jgi:hypothetical protein
LTPYYYEDTSDHGSVAWVNSQKFCCQHGYGRST